jgi:hypothetical protein
MALIIKVFKTSPEKTNILQEPMLKNGHKDLKLLKFAGKFAENHG